MLGLKAHHSVNQLLQTLQCCKQEHSKTMGWSVEREEVIPFWMQHWLILMVNVLLDNCLAQQPTINHIAIQVIKLISVQSLKWYTNRQQIQQMTFTNNPTWLMCQMLCSNTHFVTIIYSKTCSISNLPHHKITTTPKCLMTYHQLFSMIQHGTTMAIVMLHIQQNHA